VSAMGLNTAFAGLCTDLLRDGRVVRFRASGWSMEPAIRDGDVITVEPVEPGEVRTGDVVLFEADRGLTAHRVVAGLTGSRPGFLVRGSAESLENEVVALEKVLGRVERIERSGAYRRWRATAQHLRNILRIGLSTEWEHYSSSRSFVMVISSLVGRADWG
jgi:signal peptidase I